MQFVERKVSQLFNPVFWAGDFNEWRKFLFEMRKSCSKYINKNQNNSDLFPLNDFLIDAWRGILEFLFVYYSAK